MNIKRDAETGTWSLKTIIVAGFGALVGSIIMMSISWFILFIGWGIMLVSVIKPVIYVLKAHNISNTGRLVDGTVVKIEEKFPPAWNVGGSGNGAKKRRIFFEYRPEGTDILKSDVTEWLIFSDVEYYLEKPIKVAYTSYGAVIIKAIHQNGKQIYPEKKDGSKYDDKSAEKIKEIKPIIGVNIPKKTEPSEDWDYQAALPTLTEEHNAHRKMATDIKDGLTSVSDGSVNASGETSMTYADIKTGVLSESYAAPDGYQPEDAYVPPTAYRPEAAYVPPTAYRPEAAYVPPTAYIPEDAYVPRVEYSAAGKSNISLADNKSVSISIAEIKDKYGTVELLSKELNISKYDARARIEAVGTPVFEMDAEKADDIIVKLREIGTAAERK
ncbi:MAG: hypothetical protein LBQ27_02610 [Clostridiales bacterium]|jgi:hypothetical protein|nr:hypothetical protein [Clostridiales bacterium]